MKLYRVQKEDGTGPYCRDDDECYIIPVSYFRHPDLAREGVDYQKQFRGWRDEGKSVRFGFADLAQLGKWFNSSERKKLAGLGFSVHCYTVANTSDVIITPKQAAFIYQSGSDNGPMSWDEVNAEIKPTPEPPPIQEELF